MTTTALERVRGLIVQHSWDGAELDEFDALVRDAMRYRWLRDKATREQFSDMAQYNLRPHLDYLIDKELQAIDDERGGG